MRWSWPRRLREIFPGLFHIDLKGNVLPKLKMLQEFGFYRRLETPPPAPDHIELGFEAAI